MAASLPPAPSSTPANPSRSGSIHERDHKLSMTPCNGASTAASPAKIDSVPATDKAETSAEAPVPTKPSKSGRRRDRNRDRKPKPKPKRETAKCVGYYVDALDKKMLWAEARIIRCNLTTQKIRVHFVGWSKNYDLWTDPMSITSHGHYAPVTKKEEGAKSWDGDMHLFEDMLGKIEEATFTPLPVPAEDKPRVAPLPTAIKKSGDKKKKKAPSDKKKKAPTDKKAPVARPAPARQLERPAPKRKTSAISVDKASAKGSATTAKTIERNERKQEQPRSTKRSDVSAKPKENHEKRQEKQESARTTKRQKRETQQPATASPKARASKKKRAPSPDRLPMFRDLELDDGTVVDFSKQREEAQAEREAMQGFLANCALIWKKQLSALSVQ